MTIYVDLTRRFNEGGHRAILSSGQAVVLHRLAIMSKDGDWILRESAADLEHVRDVLHSYGAHYRFGAPLDSRWMSGGWSAHLEFRDGPLRIRTDFVTRPPRLEPDDLETLWEEQRGEDIPLVDVRRLVELKKTNREKDYVVIGELARRLQEPRDRFLASRSARDLLALAQEHPVLQRELSSVRPALQAATDGRDALERALAAERRALIRTNEARLRRYLEAAAAWALAWPRVAREIRGLPLPEAHTILIQRAEDVLPYVPAEATR